MGFRLALIFCKNMTILLVTLATLCIANGFVLPAPHRSFQRVAPPCNIESQQIHNSQLFLSSNPDLIPGIESIDNSNPAIGETLGSLREAPFFRLYAVDILASCEYIPQELFECYTESCEIYPVDDDEVRRVCLLFFSTLILVKLTLLNINP